MAEEQSISDSALLFPVPDAAIHSAGLNMIGGHDTTYKESESHMPFQD